MMRYWPVSSVVADLTFSISAGLEASTVTPGSTPPDASRTVPVREAWANTDAGSNRTTSNVRHFSAVRIQSVFPSQYPAQNGVRLANYQNETSVHQIGWTACKGSAEYAIKIEKVKESMC